LYQANGSLASRKAVIASLLSLILALPVVFSAYAESFTVTSNKDIYTADENAIIVGAVPMDAPEGYAVLIRVMEASARSRICCAQETTRLSQGPSGLTPAAWGSTGCQRITQT
jgi:hypothetical protein